LPFPEQNQDYQIVCFCSRLIDWVKVLRATRQSTGHLEDILTSQSLSLVLKKLNQTQ